MKHTDASARVACAVAALTLGLTLTLSFGCARTTRAAHSPLLPRNSLEAFNAAAPRSDGDLDALLNGLSQKIRSLEGRQEALLLEARYLSSRSSRGDPIRRSQLAKIEREMEVRRDLVAVLRKELQGIQELAATLQQFQRVDVEQYASAIAGLEQEWDSTWRSIPWRPPPVIEVTPDVAPSEETELPDSLAITETRSWPERRLLAANRIPAQDVQWASQRKTNWCWAAALQTTLSLLGVEVDQAVIVQRCFRGVIDDNQPYDPVIAARSLGGVWPTRHGRGVRIGARHSPGRPPPTAIVEKINAGQAFIIVARTSSTTSHAIVCYGYELYADGLDVWIFDPWPDNGFQVRAYSEADWWYDSISVWLESARRMASTRVEDQASPLALAAGE